nr:hypothetical protein HmN_000504500 [Hymenolepis microstoma]
MCTGIAMMKQYLTVLFPASIFWLEASSTSSKLPPFESRKIVAMNFLTDLSALNLTAPDPGSISDNTALNKLSSFTSNFSKVGKESSALRISCCSSDAFGTRRAHQEPTQAKIFNDK